MPSRPDCLLKLDGLEIGYDQAKVLQGPLNQELVRGEVVCLIGANGAGKTTLLRTLAGLLPPLKGRALLEQDDIHSMEQKRRAQRIGIVLTEKDFPWGLKAIEVLELARVPYTGFFGRLELTDRKMIQSIIEAFSLESLVERPLHELSDGQRQRVLIARALIQETDLLLLDEPTTFLDIQHQIEILLLLKKVASDFNKTIIMTTHHWELILELSTKLWILENESRTLVETCAEELIIRDELNDYFKLKAGQFNRETGRFNLESCEVEPIQLSIEDPTVKSWVAHAIGKWGFYDQGAHPNTLEYYKGTYLLKRHGSPALKTESLTEVINSLRWH